MGRWPRLGPLARGYAHSVADGTAVRTNVNIRNCARRWRLWLPIGETETSVRRRFFGQIFGTSQCSSVCATKWACWRQRTIGVSRFCGEVAMCRGGRSRLGWIGGGTPEVDNLSTNPLMGTFGSSISRVVGTRRHKTEPISSRNCGSFAPRPYCHCLAENSSLRSTAGKGCVWVVVYERHRPRLSTVTSARSSEMNATILGFVLRASHDAITHKERGLSCKMAERQS